MLPILRTVRPSRIEKRIAGRHYPELEVDAHDVVIDGDRARIKLDAVHAIEARERWGEPAIVLVAAYWRHEYVDEPEPEPSSEATT